MTEAYDVYKTYLALKQHFNTDSYDYFKYHGRVKANKESFLKRNDRYFFHKIAKQQKDHVGFFVSNFVERASFYPGDDYDKATKVYTKWKANNERRGYQFRQELSCLESPFFDNFKVVGGQHPQALKHIFQNKLSVETFVIINKIFNQEIVEYWDSDIQDNVVWPNMSKKIKKYGPFIEVDKRKYFDILVDIFPEISDK